MEWWTTHRNLNVLANIRLHTIISTAQSAQDRMAQKDTHALEVCTRLPKPSMVSIEPSEGELPWAMLRRWCSLKITPNGSEAIGQRNPSPNEVWSAFDTIIMLIWIKRSASANTGHAESCQWKEGLELNANTYVWPYLEWEVSHIDQDYVCAYPVHLSSIRVYTFIQNKIARG